MILLPEVYLHKTELWGATVSVLGDREGASVLFRLGKHVLRLSWEFNDPNWRKSK